MDAEIRPEDVTIDMAADALICADDIEVMTHDGNGVVYFEYLGRKFAAEVTYDD